MNKTKIAPFFIMAAAALWAFDGLFRTTLTYTFSTTSIIFFEHVLGFSFCLQLLSRISDGSKVSHQKRGEHYS